MRAVCGVEWGWLWVGRGSGRWRWRVPSAMRALRRSRVVEAERATFVFEKR